MDYTSLIFFFFVFIVAAVYFFCPGRWRWAVLLAASYFFYWVSSRWAIFYMLATTLTTFLAAKAIGGVSQAFERAKADAPQAEQKALKAAAAKRKRLYLVAALLFNFGILAVLKYGNFAFRNLNVVLSALGLGAFPLTSFLLPLGISFYTFQAMGYLIDVYRGKYKADKNLPKFALFVSFFPQIVQGPIGRHDELAAQLYAPNRFDFERLKSGLLLAAYGLVKKLVIADRIAILVNNVYDNGAGAEYGSVVLFAALLYSMQVYCDFSGGIDVSRGVAQIFGITLAENFRRPFYSQSLAEYWRRWHITLGAWMRDYLFYPLALSKPYARLSKAARRKWGASWARIIPTAGVSFVVYLVVGIWHGAEWRYVAFALWNSLIITASTILEPAYAKFHALGVRGDSFSYKMLCRTRTALITTIGRNFGRGNGLRHALFNIFTVFANFQFAAGASQFLSLGLEARDFVILGCGIAMLVIVGMKQERGHSMRQLLAQQNIWLRWAVYLGIVAVLILLPPVVQSDAAKEFIYANF